MPNFLDKPLPIITDIEDQRLHDFRRGINHTLNEEIKRFDILINNFNVLAYGAKGDGVHDDTIPIKKAIDAATTNGSDVLFPMGVYLVTSTLSIPSGVSLVGAVSAIPYNLYLSRGTYLPKILFDPSSANTHCVELVADAANYVWGISFRNLAIVGQTDGTAGDAFHLDFPGWCLFENLFILNCECGISINRGISNIIRNCSIQSYTSDMDVGLEIRDDGDGVTTTTYVENTYFSGFDWSARLEFANSTHFSNCVFESAAAGGVDIYKKCGPTYFAGCYSEDVPTTAIAAPIIQVGVNGTGGTGYTCQVTIDGGSYAGFNGTHHASSSFINADKAAQISVVGAFVTRVGKTFVTTSNTLQINDFANQGSSITSWDSGINNMGYYVGDGGNLSGALQTRKVHSRSFQTNDGSDWVNIQQSGTTQFWGTANGNFLFITDNSIRLGSYTTGGGLKTQWSEATADVTATATFTIQVNVPSGAKLIGVQLKVDTALAAGDTWDAEWNDGSSMQAIATNQAVAINTKVNKFHDDNANTPLTDAETDIVITKNGGGSFTAQGTIRAIVFYETFKALD